MPTVDAAGPDATASSCPAPPTTESAQAIQALNTLNNVRSLMGVPCAALVPALDTSAQKHCDYYAGNASNMMCISNPHAEVAGCAGFVGASPGTREAAAGYPSMRGWSEVMAFTGSPTRADQTWIDSVWHRIPMLSPWTKDMGYGGTTTPAACDTIDFGGQSSAPSTLTALYPYNGQTGVPTSFNGQYEGPMPPVPPSGWPSGYPVTLYLQGGVVQSHQITVDGTTTPIAHVWIDGTNPTNAPDDYFIYTYTPLKTNTTYHVQIAATQSGMSLSFDWKFTTGAK
ncbi:MAG: hypothetical protein M3O46_07555 [Myxococcota bacterium]|nr:hypothetical protein [Myxococcota bacterium]